MNNSNSSGAPQSPEFSEQQKQNLLNRAGQSIGQDPAKLRQAVESGSMDQVVRSLSPEQSEQLARLLNDPEATKKLLSSKQAQMLFRMFGGK